MTTSLFQLISKLGTNIKLQEYLRAVTILHAFEWVHRLL